MIRNIMSFNETENMARNLDMLEGRLGHEVPRELLLDTDLSSGILSFNEIDNMARNLNMLEIRRRVSNNSLISRIELALYSGVGIAFIIYAINYVFRFFL